MDMPHGKNLFLPKLWEKLIDSQTFDFPYANYPYPTGRGLSDLVEWCFGKPMDKANQYSVWLNRPLREAQQVYAALDAYVLVEIYNFMRNNSGDDFEQYIERMMDQEMAPPPPQPVEPVVVFKSRSARRNAAKKRNKQNRQPGQGPLLYCGEEEIESKKSKDEDEEIVVGYTADGRPIYVE